MKPAPWILGVCLAFFSLPAPAQEAPAVPPAAGPAVRPPKGGANPLFGMLGSSQTNAGGMTIVSDRIEYDYKELIIAFDDHVKVTDPRFTMTCDRMLVFLEGTNQIKRVIAIGNVDGTQPDRHATCDRAVYERATGEIVMTGSPVLTRGADRVTGAKITVFQNDQRVIIEGGGRVNLSPETMKNREIKP